MNQKVTLPAHRRKGVDGGVASDTVQFADVAASELCADDVGVLGERDDHIRVEVDTGCHAWEVAGVSSAMRGTC